VVTKFGEGRIEHVGKYGDLIVMHCSSDLQSLRLKQDLDPCSGFCTAHTRYRLTDKVYSQLAPSQLRPKTSLTLTLTLSPNPNPNTNTNTNTNEF